MVVIVIIIKGSWIVYLKKLVFKFCEKKLEDAKRKSTYIHQRYPRLQEFDEVLRTPEAYYASYSQGRYDSKRRWIVVLFLDH